MVGTNQDRCDGILGEREAIEFAVRTSSSSDFPWIPLRISYGIADSRKPSKGSNGGSSHTRTVRGYTVPTVGRRASRVSEHVAVCGDVLRDASEIQLRWMGTAELKGKERERSDIWALASVTATLFVGNQTEKIFEDSFGSNSLK